MDIFFRQITSYLSWPSSISPRPSPFAPQPHSEHIRWFLRGMTQPLHCSQLANLSLRRCCDIGGCVYGLRCHWRNCTRNWSCIAHRVLSLPPYHPPLPPSCQKQSWVAESGLWSHFYPPRTVTVLTGGWHGRKGPELLAKLSHRRALPNTDPLSPPPPLLAVLFWQVKTNVIFLPCSSPRWIYTLIISCPDHLIRPPAVICLFKGNWGGGSTFNAELLLSIMIYECALNNERSSWA